MSITLEEAIKIARAYKLTLTDAETLIRLTGPEGTYEDAKRIAVDLAGSNEERAGQAHTDARKKQDAAAAAELERYHEYQAKHPKPPKPERKQVVPDLRDGMSDNDRARAVNEADAANVKAAAEEKYDEAQQQSKDYYNWKANLRRPEQGGG